MRSKLRMLAGGIVDAGGGGEGAVSAYVVLAAGLHSRLFKVSGPTSSPRVVELAAATTIDLQRFQRELNDDLGPTLASLRDRGAAVGIATPSEDWIAECVEKHLAANAS